MGKKDRKTYVKIGKELGTLTAEDIEYMLDPARSENDVIRRLTTARKRKSSDEADRRCLSFSRC